MGAALFLALTAVFADTEDQKLIIQLRHYPNGPAVHFQTALAEIIAYNQLLTGQAPGLSIAAGHLVAAQSLLTDDIFFLVYIRTLGQQGEPKGLSVYYIVADDLVGRARRYVFDDDPEAGHFPLQLSHPDNPVRAPGTVQEWAELDAARLKEFQGDEFVLSNGGAIKLDDDGGIEFKPLDRTDLDTQARIRRLEHIATTFKPDTRMLDVRELALTAKAIAQDWAEGVADSRPEEDANCKTWLH